MNNQPTKAGIYRIVNGKTETTYIGSSIHAAKRLVAHRGKLSRRVHENVSLQRAWTKYGAEAFTFEVLVECQASELAAREQRFIDAYADHGLALFNMRQSSESTVGFSMTAEVRAKISGSSKGKVFSLASRQKMSAAHLGIPISLEARLKMSKARKGVSHLPGRSKMKRWTHSQASRTNMSISKKAFYAAKKKRLTIQDGGLSNGT